MAGPGISTKNTEKITPRPEIQDPEKIPRKYPENTRKIPRKYQKCPFWVCSRGIFLGFLNFGPGVFFRHFSWKLRVRPFRVSLAGGGILNSKPLLSTFSEPFFTGNVNKTHSKPPSKNFPEPFPEPSRGGHLKPVILKPVIRIFCIFHVFVSAFSAFSAFFRVFLSESSQTLVFSGMRGTFRIFRVFLYRFRIADFENPTDRL